MALRWRLINERLGQAKSAMQERQHAALALQMARYRKVRDACLPAFRS